MSLHYVNIEEIKKRIRKVFSYYFTEYEFDHGSNTNIKSLIFVFNSIGVSHTCINSDGNIIWFRVHSLKALSLLGKQLDWRYGGPTFCDSENITQSGVVCELDNSDCLESGEICLRVSEQHKEQFLEFACNIICEYLLVEREFYKDDNYNRSTLNLFHLSKEFIGLLKAHISDLNVHTTDDGPEPYDGPKLDLE